MLQLDESVAFEAWLSTIMQLRQATLYLSNGGLPSQFCIRRATYTIQLSQNLVTNFTLPL